MTALGFSFSLGTNGASLLLSISSRNASWGLGMSTTLDTIDAYLAGPLRAADATVLSWCRMRATYCALGIVRACGFLSSYRKIRGGCRVLELSRCGMRTKQARTLSACVRVCVFVCRLFRQEGFQQMRNNSNGLVNICFKHTSLKS